MGSESDRAPYPPGITDRHEDIGARPWARWICVAFLAALPVLALLNVFGQHVTTSRASSPVADVSVSTPARLRSGLQASTRVQVVAHSTIGHLALAFSQGWWDGIGVNSIEPQPSMQTARDGQIVLDMGSLPAGQTMTTWINFNVNPTAVGSRDEDLTVLDGSHTLVRLHRSVTIFP
jgi:hypothetical protein